MAKKSHRRRKKEGDSYSPMKKASCNEEANAVWTKKEKIQAKMVMMAPIWGRKRNSEEKKRKKGKILIVNGRREKRKCKEKKESLEGRRWHRVHLILYNARSLSEGGVMMKEIGDLTERHSARRQEENSPERHGSREEKETADENRSGTIARAGIENITQWN